MRTGNPVFNSQTFQTPGGAMAVPAGVGLSAPRAERAPGVMSVRGTAWKTLYLVAVAIITAAASWNYFVQHPGAILFACLGSLVGGLITGFVVLRAGKASAYVVPLFACCEGTFLAAISVAVVKYSSLAQKIGSSEEALALVGQAAGLTLAIAAGMLLAYAAGMIRLRGVAAKVVITMTAGVMIYYLGAFLINLVFGNVVPRLGWDAGPLGIGFSVFMVVLASLNLVLDFQFVEDGARRGLPKHMEWVAAFGLLTTLVWLYIEVLRLLAKLRR